MAKALLGRTVLADGEPWVTGPIGLLGSTASWHLMQECDTLLIVGSNLPYSEFLPPEGAARGVQIDLDGRRLGFRYPTEVNLVGDSAATLRALLPLLDRKDDRSWRERVEGWTRTGGRPSSARALLDADPINPQRVVWELDQRLPADAMIACDTGTATGFFARDLHLTPDHLAWISGNLLTMGSAVPYAIAAKLAHPDRPAIALVGDGAMQMNGLGELVTIQQRWQSWARPAADHRRLQQPRPELRHVGAAGDGRRREVLRLAGPARRAVRAVRRAARPGRAARRAPRGPRAGVGRRAEPPTGRSSSTSSSTPTCRRCRRTSPASRRATWPRRCGTATRTAAGVIRQAFRQVLARVGALVMTQQAKGFDRPSHPLRARPPRRRHRRSRRRGRRRRRLRAALRGRRRARHRHREPRGAHRFGADEDPAVVVAQAVVLYLAHRRDEVDDDDDDIARLAARAEFNGNPPQSVTDWLADRGVRV